jgi:hypothetical protein
MTFSESSLERVCADLMMGLGLIRSKGMPMMVGEEACVGEKGVLDER